MIDHVNKLIFIHIPRTGGSSIEHALVDKDWGHIDADGNDQFFLKHITAEEARRVYMKEWKGYAKFSVVRNPWDKAVSDYLWSTHRFETYSNIHSFEQFVKTPPEKAFSALELNRAYKWGIPQTYWLTPTCPYWMEVHPDDKMCQVPGWNDYVDLPSHMLGHNEISILRFENLEREFYDYCKYHIGIEPGDVVLPHTNNMERPHYSTYYTTDEMVDCVARWYKIDIDNFNYTFDR